MSNVGPGKTAVFHSRTKYSWIAVNRKGDAAERRISASDADPARMRALLLVENVKDTISFQHQIEDNDYINPLLLTQDIIIIIIIIMLWTETSFIIILIILFMINLG